MQMLGNGKRKLKGKLMTNENILMTLESQVVASVAYCCQASGTNTRTDKSKQTVPAYYRKLTFSAMESYLQSTLYVKCIYCCIGGMRTNHARVRRACPSNR